jgi:ubiquinone/menaquinone biosynthesis C-methylase UbiE
MGSERDPSPVSRVHRSKERARESYDRLSVFYDRLAGHFEEKYRKDALDRLAIVQGERILELGSGTGQGLARIAESAGKTGRVCGIDISPGMLEVSRKRLEKAGLADRVELVEGDAASLPFRDGCFDGVFCGFTLELFDTPEIPVVLREVKRVLRPGGRFAIVGMSKGERDSVPTRLYEWLHERFPTFADCRPIRVEGSIRDAGFRIVLARSVSLYGLPTEIVVARA